MMGTLVVKVLKKYWVTCVKEYSRTCISSYQITGVSYTFNKELKIKRSLYEDRPLYLNLSSRKGCVSFKETTSNTHSIFGNILECFGQIL